MKVERDGGCGELLCGEDGVHKNANTQKTMQKEIDRILNKASMRELRMVLQFIKPLDK